MPRSNISHGASALALFVFVSAFAGSLHAQATHVISGVVHDPSSAVVPGATIQILGPQQHIAAAATTDDQGRFRVSVTGPGAYLVVVRAPGFADTRASVKVPLAEGRPLDLVIGPAPLHEDVSVTATIGSVGTATSLTQPANVIDADEIGLRAKSVVAQAAAEEVGLHLQRTSPTMAGVFVRGLTGNKVNVFVDGVRYSTGAQRGGISTFLDLIDPATLDSIEVLRGPNSAQYGSDALGGSLQFLSRVPSIGVEGRGGVDGQVSIAAGSADRNVGTNLTASFGRPHVGVLVAFAGRRIGNVRPGGGVDSHAAVTRFFGVRSDRLMPAHLSDTGFSQYGGHAMLNWTPHANRQIVTSYRRSLQDDGKRYDQMLGGDGNLVADLRHLMLDLFYVRFEQIGAGWFDHASVTASINSQREERVNQGGNGNPLSAINHEPERTTAYGIQATLRKQLSPRQSLVVGADFYPEHITASSYAFDPATGATSVRRGRVPDGATYRSGGAFAQAIIDAVPSKLRIVANARVSGARYTARAADSPLVNGRPLWPDDGLSQTGSAFRAGMVSTVSDAWSVTANVSRGFRAPHITDLGTLGLTGAGFEVTSQEVAGLGASVGSTADGNAVSLGDPVDQVGPETSLTYEGGVHFRSPSVRSSLALFVNEVHDNIAKQALILPPGAIGKTLGGTPITAQNASGAVFVAAATNPVLVRVNFDNARILGVEHTFEWRPAPQWQAATTFTYLYAKDTRTGLASNIEGGTPAPDGYVRLSYFAPHSRWWAGAYLHAAAAQARLSTLDLEDRRTGAGRTRASIRSFFLNGATARGFIGAGGDGALGTADDVLLATGETLAQIQDRVLGAGVASAPLFAEVAAFVTVGVRGGLRFGRHEILIDAENIGDRNYRGISSGLDAPGRGISARYVVRF